MADSTSAPGQKANKVTQATKPADHPKYSDMVKSAIADLKERGGSSRQKILKYILANFKVSEEKIVNTHLKIALRNGVKTGNLNQSKGTGASGSFRLSDATKKAMAKPEKLATKEPVVKKPASKNSAAKRITKVKKPKSPAKKVSKISASTKSTAKKSTPKKATKKKPVTKH